MLEAEHFMFAEWCAARCRRRINEKLYGDSPPDRNLRATPRRVFVVLCAKGFGTRTVVRWSGFIEPLHFLKS